jgi:dTDP-4-dehydrorhamnose reductase
MRILITGATGALGGYLMREAAQSGLKAAGWSNTRRGGELFGLPLQLVDLADQDAVVGAFRQVRPDGVLHAGALASVAACHRQPERAQRINVEGSALLAELTAEAGGRLVLVSTDLVFDGEKGWYTELDRPAPLSAYGQSKLLAEGQVLSRPRTAVARLSLLFGPTLTARGSFFEQQVQALRAGKPVRCYADEWRTPLSLAAAAQALLALARSDFEGLLHIGGPERLSRLEMGRRLAAYLGADPNLIVAATRNQMPGGEPRPRDTSFDSGKWRALFPGQDWPSWQHALAEMGPF